MITNLSYKVCKEFPCGFPCGLCLSVNGRKIALVSPNVVWTMDDTVSYMFEKIPKTITDGIRGEIRVSRFANP